MQRLRTIAIHIRINITFSMELNLTFLGTSTSVGVPVIGCDCPTCLSEDPKNQRTRSSIYIQTPSSSLLVDTGPDLHTQALRERLTIVDAVLYTHTHMDHITGFDELRAFCWRRDEPLPLYGSRACLEELQRMFRWAFDSKNTYRGYVRPDARIVDSRFTLDSLSITPLPVLHGSVETHGYCFQTASGFRLAYIPDVKTIPPSTLALLGNLDCLIIDGLREESHPTHLSILEACEISETLGSPQTWLTHISHEVDITERAKTLPAHVAFAYDGLQLSSPA